MGVNHRGSHVFVPEELLNGTNIISILQQMRSETVPKGMTARHLGQPGGSDRVADGILQVALGNVVAAFFAAARIER